MTNDETPTPVVLDLDHDLDAVELLADLLGELAAELWLAGAWEP